jgi:hypothetical protein
VSVAKTTKTTKTMDLLVAFEGACVMRGLVITRAVEEYVATTEAAMVGLHGWGKLDRGLKPQIQALIPILEAGRAAHVQYHARVLGLCAIHHVETLKAASETFEQDPAVVQHNAHYGKQLILATPAELEGLPDYTGSETLRAQVCDAFIAQLNEALSLTTSTTLGKIAKMVKGLHKAISWLPEELTPKAHEILGTYAAAWCNEMLVTPMLRDDQKVTVEKTKILWGACQENMAQGMAPDEALSRSLMKLSFSAMTEALSDMSGGSLRSMLGLLDACTKPGDDAEGGLKRMISMMDDIMKEMPPQDQPTRDPAVVDAPPLRFVESANPV